MNFPQLVLAAYLPFALLCFAMIPPRRAVLVTLLAGPLFLPEITRFQLQGFVDYQKVSAVSFSTLMGILIFDAGRLATFRPRPYDWLAAAFLLCPMATSLSNGLGFYDGVSAVAEQVLRWGVPYLAGRLYFRDVEGLRELSVAVLLAALVYLPLVLLEVRLSPQLHNWVYGFTQRPFFMIKRYDGYRPMVFMASSLMVGFFMAFSTVLAWWSWRAGMRRIWRVPMPWFVATLFVTTLLCKTLGSITLMLVGVAICELTRRQLRKLALTALLVVAAVWPMLRVSGLMSADRVISVASVVYDPQRIQSLGVRLDFEDALVKHTAQRRILGWGGWGRGLVTAEGYGHMMIDGQWIITYSTYGMVGLLGLMGFFLTPMWRVVRLGDAALRSWAAIPAALGLCGTLYFIDSISNAFVHQPLIAVMAAVGTARLSKPRVAAADAAEPAPAPRAPRAAAEPEPAAAPARGEASLGRALLRGSKRP